MGRVCFLPWLLLQTIGKLPKDTKLKADTMIGYTVVFWNGSWNTFFIAIAPGYMPDMTSYLFGDILSVSTGSLIYMAAFSAAVVIMFLMLYNHLVLYMF